ncbi:MAG: zinc ribbon domain-containing protein [Methanofollis sp.]|nr:zinc ribbon domain-containing protein [Methanofollis sp.]
MAKFCPECGNELISPNAEICPKCGVRIKENPEKSPGIAALCSLIFTGLGQVYNGNFGRGFLILVGTMIGSLFYVIPGLIVAIYGIYDAYSTAKQMNAGEIPYKETNALHMILFVGLWIMGIVAFVIVAAIVGAFVFGMSGTPSSY